MSISERWQPGEEKCSQLKGNVNNLISIAEGQIYRMRNDRKLLNLYEKARDTSNPATGTVATWVSHQIKARALMDRIYKMIELGWKLQCDMSIEYSRYISLQIPFAPD